MREMPRPTKQTKRGPTIEQIKRAVAADYRLPVADLESSRRAREVARPRQIAMYLAKRLTPKSMSQIGRSLGGRNHTTVIYGVRRIERLSAEDEEFDRRVRSIEVRLGVGAPPAPRPELQLSFLSGPLFDAPLFDAGGLPSPPIESSTPRPAAPAAEPAIATPARRRSAFNIVRAEPEQLPPRVDRSSCPRCGTRRAIGCSHTAALLSVAFA